jgi:hypothetical protein
MRAYHQLIIQHTGASAVRESQSVIDLLIRGIGDQQRY